MSNKTNIKEEIENKIMKPKKPITLKIVLTLVVVLVVAGAFLGQFKPIMSNLAYAATKAENFFTRTLTQDFNWGVLVLNPNKAIYAPGEKAVIDLSVLDDKGDMDCKAKIILDITNPAGKTVSLSTENKKIIISDECTKSVTNKPDFSTEYQTTIPGTYQMHLKGITKNGTQEIDDYFTVQDKPTFDITRGAPTRIYPPQTYKMVMTVKANTDFTGSITETVPSSYTITPGTFTINEAANNKILTWTETFKPNETKTLEYFFKTPPLSPEFYLLGPLQFTNTTTNGSTTAATSNKVIFTEPRQWQIAGDATCSAVFDRSTYSGLGRTACNGCTNCGTTFTSSCPLMAGDSFTFRFLPGWIYDGYSITEYESGGLLPTYFNAVITVPIVYAAVGPNDHTRYISAFCHPRTNTITPSAEQGCNISPNTNQTLKTGEKSGPYYTKKTFNMTANAGYYLKGYSIDGGSTIAGTSYSFSNISSDHTIKAMCGQNWYCISTGNCEAATTCPAGKTCYATNAECIMRAPSNCGGPCTPIAGTPGSCGASKQTCGATSGPGANWRTDTNSYLWDCLGKAGSCNGAFGATAPCSWPREKYKCTSIGTCIQDNTYGNFYTSNCDNTCTVPPPSCTTAITASLTSPADSAEITADATTNIATIPFAMISNGCLRNGLLSYYKAGTSDITSVPFSNIPAGSQTHNYPSPASGTGTIVYDPARVVTLPSGRQATLYYWSFQATAANGTISLPQRKLYVVLPAAPTETLGCTIAPNKGSTPLTAIITPSGTAPGPYTFTINESGTTPITRTENKAFYYTFQKAGNHTVSISAGSITSSCNVTVALSGGGTGGEISP